MFYPALLALGGTPATRRTRPTTPSATTTRSATAGGRRPPAPGRIDEWGEAVSKARAANGEHLDEEEREGMPDFIRSASRDVRHELAMKWVRF